MDAEVNPLYKYLYETFSDEEYKTEFEDNYKESSNNNIYVRTDALLNNYKEYLVTNEMTYIKINYKLLKLLLLRHSQLSLIAIAKGVLPFFSVDILVLCILAPHHSIKA